MTSEDQLTDELECCRCGIGVTRANTTWFGVHDPYGGELVAAPFCPHCTADQQDYEDTRANHEQYQ